MRNYFVLGIMSGTSLDGIDLCYACFSHSRKKWTYEVLSATTIAYEPAWREKLKNAHKLSGKDLLQLDQSYASFLADQVLFFKKTNHIEKIDLIASHGHTIFHQPSAGFSYQIGNHPVLSLKTNHTVVCDFRKQDVLLGGQGAPLVPVGDELLFPQYTYCLNLGGFANISYREDGKRLAYDICPVNVVLNFLAQKINMPYDKDGAAAKSGNIHTSLLQELNQLSYYTQPPPKSLGIEWVNQMILPLLDKYKNIQTIDLIATYTEHIAMQVARVIDKKGEVLVTGGGAYNSFLVETIHKKLSHATVLIPDDKLIGFKEAIIFGLLGVLKYIGEDNVYSTVTGASKNHSAGIIYK